MITAPGMADTGSSAAFAPESKCSAQGVVFRLVASVLGKPRARPILDCIAIDPETGRIELRFDFANATGIFAVTRMV